jgi:hypothetical protein
MDSSTALATSGLSLPNFPLATGDLLHVIENSVSVISTSTDNAGEYYSMAMASVVPAREVKERAVIIIPLSAPRRGSGLYVLSVASNTAAEVPRIRRMRLINHRRSMRLLSSRRLVTTQRNWRLQFALSEDPRLTCRCSVA